MHGETGGAYFLQLGWNSPSFSTTYTPPKRWCRTSCICPVTFDDPPQVQQCSSPLPSDILHLTSYIQDGTFLNNQRSAMSTFELWYANIVQCSLLQPGLILYHRNKQFTKRLCTQKAKLKLANCLAFYF